MIAQRGYKNVLFVRLLNDVSTLQKSVTVKMCVSWRRSARQLSIFHRTHIYIPVCVRLVTHTDVIILSSGQ